MATSAALSSTSSPATQTTFLQHIQQELDPTFLSNIERKSTLWKVADVATMVAFTALAAGALVTCGLYAPLFVPLTGMTALLLFEGVSRIQKNFREWSKDAGDRANQIRAFQNHYQSLAQATSADIQQILERKGIRNIPGMGHNDVQLTTLKPLIARQMFWEEHTADLQKKAMDCRAEANRLGGRNFQEHREEIFNLRCEALEWDGIAMRSKCKDAFIHAMIRRPGFIGDVGDLGTFPTLSGSERAVILANGIPEANQFFKFKNTSFPPLLMDEVKNQPVSHLGIRMAQVLPA